ncbi:MAG: alanine racemase [Gemmatimonadaceae bacterium]
MNPSQTRAWLEIDLAAVQRNAAALAGHAGVPLLPMVKADAYGLGAVEVARALEPLGPWGFGVATVAEGIELRSAGVSRPIAVFTPVLSAELPDLRAAGLTPGLGSAEQIRQWKLYGRPYHLSVDTGMSRAGVPWREVPELVAALADSPPEGAFTHFHSAQLPDSSMAFQEARFIEAVTSLPARPRLLHAEASAGIVRNGRSRWDMVRPGIFLYGVSTVADAAIEPEPVVHLRARVVDIRWLEPRDTVSYDATFTAASRRLIATISAGYADGYPRSLGNIGVAIVRGRRVTIAGRVTMDMIMLDVTGIQCEIGDIATLIGRAERSDDLISVAAVSELAGMSPYELLTGLRGRLTRTYTNG